MEHPAVDAHGRHAEQQQQDSGSQHAASPEPKPRGVHTAATDKADAVVSLREAMHAVHEHNQSQHVKTRVKRLDKGTKAYIDGMLRRAQHRTWCQAHGKTLPPPKLSPVILRVIREWFDLVDDDGSGTLEHHELLAALQVGTGVLHVIRMTMQPTYANVCCSAVIAAVPLSIPCRMLNSVTSGLHA
eukprot:GHUV01038910.1.p1 GENE.GHUV01038910.1~~GHUV01038910.1.p1  ORF type:complete len:186 (+),score=31.95 GHUV01038910.1:326-883(+)